jgi:hypothetical protein
MQRIATSILIWVLLVVSGCATRSQSGKSVLPATTPYDTNAEARAVYLRFYGDAYRIAAAGRTNIVYKYEGMHVRAATDGQWMGVHAGLQVVRAWGLQRLRSGPQLPKITPYDGEPKARAAYLRSYRQNYLDELSGRHGISCFPQTRVAAAYCEGERAGQRQARRDTLAVEEHWLAQYSLLSASMSQQQPQIRYDPSPSPFWEAVGMVRTLLNPFGF